MWENIYIEVEKYFSNVMILNSIEIFKIYYFKENAYLTKIPTLILHFILINWNLK